MVTPLITSISIPQISFSFPKCPNFTDTPILRRTSRPPASISPTHRPHHPLISYHSTPETTTSSASAAMSKDCGKHKSEKFYGAACACIASVIILVLLIVLIVWLTLRPTKPHFYLQDATVLTFNLSGVPPSLLTSVLQVTISSRNSNDRIGIRYDRLTAYAVYKNQQITLAVSIPPLYQGHNDVEVWSPYLYGTSIPIAPYLSAALSQDEAAGFLVLYVRLDGRIRWKVGSWTSGRYHLDVSCPAFLSFNDGKGSGSGPSIRFQQLSTCSVNV